MPVNLFPRASVDQGAITQMRQKSGKVVQDLARGTNSVANLLYRNLRATDVEGGTLTGHLVNPSALTANQYATDVFPNFTTKQTQAFAIFGIALLNDAPTLDEVTIYVGADIVAVLPLGEIKAPASGTTPQEGYIFDPVWVPPQTHCRIDLLSGDGQTISLEAFNLIGYVGEKSGDTVNAQHQVVASQAEGAQ